ncbi:MAG: DNA-directed RNA polymerase subunit A' [Nanoarchaeota archaeon]|nr:DNA-directed RNA polymerase subunit A' [Nanoarchaeota archaeon]
MEVQPHKKIAQLEFGIMSPRFIKDMASAKIVTPELYDKEGYPVDGGLMDVRLGVIDPGLKCKTCGQKLKECPGHFGFIELARPVVHIKFINVIMDLLRCTCRDCSRILIPKNKIDKFRIQIEEVGEISGLTARRKTIKEFISALKTVNKCPYCKAKQFKITLEKPTTVIEDEKRLSPIEIRTRLEKVTDSDIELFGIRPESVRPEWMILTILPIPPVTMRPSITLESGERSEDDLTHKLGDIVRINQRLFENINAGAPEIIIEDLWDLLQYHVTTFIDNNVAQLPPARHRGGQPLKTLTARIKSKEGRIRHNLVGKRTNFSARTVISPDPKLQINEVGVPLVIAMKLTVPERTTEWNMKYLKEFIERGPGKYPGSNYIIRPDGKRKKITDETKEQLLEEIQPGYIVERHLMDGDVTLFNRQPSLHRMSMMCHRVRVLPGLTLRLNPAVCAPYNADFDGDEMNLHVPQTEEARAEAEILMEVQTQLISPRYGLSIIGCNQDAISGNYILTQPWFKVPRSEAIDMLSAIGIEDFSKFTTKETVTGKEIFSYLLPTDFNFKGLSRLYKDAPEDPDSVVEIKNGKILHGIMDKNNLGEGSGLLLRTLHKKYGSTAMVDILGKMYRLGIETLFRHGFSVSLSDLDLPAESHKEVKDILLKAEQEVEDFIAKYNDGSLEAMPGRSREETLELRILERLNRARDDSGRIVTKKSKQNSHMMNMVRSGSRGNVINLAQMAACVGQQALRGGRISIGYRGRTLSCFNSNDLRAPARGFIRNGFKDGLKPHEAFFMAMTGRDSLMDTALRTPKSGYLYRRLANALQDLKVEYDYTVRDAGGRIVQFQYGEDSVDVSKSEAGKINIRKIVRSVE